MPTPSTPTPSSFVSLDNIAEWCYSRLNSYSDEEMASTFSRIYDFDRFWCPVEGMIELDHYGYLRDPETYTDWMGQSDSVPYEYIEDVPCLILLGEPGIGKSLWFQQRRETLRDKVRAGGNRDLWVDLGSYDQAPDVVDAVFHHAEFVRWHQGVHRLHLFLDGFDECLSHVRVLPKRFLKELRKYPVERLCLRVLCRTAEWPKTLEDGLKELWAERYWRGAGSGRAPKDTETAVENQASAPVQAFRLTPLRRRDVEEIVKGEGLDPESLLKEIESKDLVPFAIKPQTLAFLLKTYKSHGSFPSTQVELYRQGCRELCREPNLERVEAGISREFSTDDRLALASRIAAFTIFGNRPSIPRYDIPANEIKDTDIALGDLLHGTERVSGKELSVTEGLIRETLNTGLFTSRPGNRMGWAHQTYAEFLAAEYLVRNELPVQTIMRLIQHPHVLEGKIPPSLGETASWLSLMKPEILEALMSTDPEILLLKRHELTTAEERHDVRRRLVGALLALLDEGRLLDQRISRTARLSDLDHPGLADQLRPYIEDSEKNFVVRRVAIALAEQNYVSELQHAICDVALSPEDHYLVRKPAVRAVLAMGSEEEKARLKPLAFGQSGEYPDDELKGCAFLALWPNHLASQELFDSLGPPNRPNWGSSYQAFLSGPLLERMEPSHLPDALRWVRQQERQDSKVFSFGSLIDSIMAFAWKHLDSPGVLDEFARAALHRLDNVEKIVPSGSGHRGDSVLFADDFKRRRLASKMIQLASGSARNARLIAHRISDVICFRDLPWLIEMFETQRDAKAQEAVAWLICWFFHDADTELFEKLFELSESNTIFGEAFRNHRDPVDLDSEEAQGLRRMHERQQRLQSSEEGGAQIQPLSQEMISNYLDGIERGGSSRFAGLVRRMVRAEQGSGDPWPLSLTKCQTWRTSDDAVKERIIRAAHQYALEGDPERDEWVGTSSVSWNAWAGYYALRLLWDETRESAADLPEEVWLEWAPAIVACFATDEDSSASDLIVAAYKRIPEGMISNLKIQIQVESKESGHLFVLDRFEPCWDDRLSDTLVALLNDETLTPKAIESLLHALLKHGVPEAVEFAKAQLVVPLPTSDRGRGAALAAAKILMMYEPEDGWSNVWSVVVADQPFGRALIFRLAEEMDFRFGKIFDQIGEGHLASLYTWISREFPPADDSRSDRMLRTVGPRDLAQSVLRFLQDRGTVEALDALKDLQKDLPDQAEDLRWVIAVAKDRFLATSWTPWLPSEILAIVTDHRRRLVRSGHHLLEVMVESLERFQQAIHSEIPAVRDLWDRQVGKSKKGRKKAKPKDSDPQAGQTTWRPVQEADLSDRIARRLREDLSDWGIVIGREVQIRRGELTDIHVDAVSEDSRADRLDLVKVIIEVKGCWNDGIDTDMQEQLVGRYLSENECDYGLYLVGWFHCDQWDENDYRCTRPTKEICELSVDQARERFDEQAERLSQTTGKVIKAFVLDAGMRPTAGTSRSQ